MLPLDQCNLYAQCICVLQIDNSLLFTWRQDAVCRVWGVTYDDVEFDSAAVAMPTCCQWPLRISCCQQWWCWWDSAKVSHWSLSLLLICPILISGLWLVLSSVFLLPYLVTSLLIISASWFCLHRLWCCIDYLLTYLQGVPEKMRKVLHVINLELFTVKWRFLQSSECSAEITVMNCIKMLSMLMFFEYFTFWVLNKEHLTAVVKLCSFLRYQIICEHFSENLEILWLTVIKLWCIKLCTVFSGTPYAYVNLLWSIVWFTVNFVHRRCSGKIVVGWIVTNITTLFCMICVYYATAL